MNCSCGHAYAGPRQAKSVAFIILFILSLASRSAAEPQAALKPHSPKVPLNRELRVTLELAWAGEADVYDIPQPDTSVLPEFRVINRKIFATRNGDENRLQYEFTMKPLKEGEYDLGRMQVKYYEKDKDIPTPISLPHTMVKVLPAELLSTRAKAGIGACAVGAIAVVAMVLFVRSRKVAEKKKMTESETLSHARANLLVKLDGARPLLLEGKTGEYLDILCGIAESVELRPHIEKLDDLRDLAEGVKFGGHTSSPDQLGWAEKLVRTAVEKAFPHEEQEEEENESGQA